MVFHARPEELKACKSAILKNISVDVVGRVGSGRSKLLKAIAVELLDAGRKVITISGYPATSHMPLRALELAGFGTALGQSDTATSNDPASALIASVSGYPSVLIVDDAHFLDDDSWTVLASIHAETKTPLVISRANFAADTASPSERSIPSITPSGIMLKLGPLTFEATTALLLHRLGGPAELDVLSNIYRLSGGIPSLVTAIADAATMSGRLTPEMGSGLCLVNSGTKN
ncbi:AAA family ATPase [Leucobacter coleopterorum]|uniref:AAA family ATPase n=1 Tax=Leucobacter coleopterorum TaxID=2714933 RepID=A0ABX6JZA0_9MICO|nr:AAA family ATPase [Leucobacter coleopterorum]QIM18095.1 AAA family ATPase [Leucobacter coleopterorum]